MKKMALILTAFLLVTCIKRSDFEINNEPILFDISETTFENPSFLGNKIEESTGKEVFAVMTTYQYLREGVEPNPRIVRKNNETEYDYIIDRTYSERVVFYFEHDKLKQVSIRPTDLSLGQVIARFGEPDYVYSDQNMTPRGPDVWMTFLYTDIGIQVSGGIGEKKNEYYVNKDAQIGVVNLVSLNDIHFFYENDLELLNPNIQNPSDFLYEWKGYGKLSELYPNIIRSEN